MMESDGIENSQSASIYSCVVGIYSNFIFMRERRREREKERERKRERERESHVYQCFLHRIPGNFRVAKFSRKWQF